MEITVSQFLLFGLLFARITSVIVAMPVLGHQGIPPQAKIALGLFLSLVMFPLVSSNAPKVELQLLSFVVLVVQEIFVGLSIGFAAGLLFAGVRYAGELIGFDMGFSAANVFDPESAQNVPLIGEFLYLIMLLTFVVLNGHHFVLQALYLSYSAVPIGEFAFNGPLVEKMTAMTGLVFVVAVKLAAPVIVAIFLTNVALAVLARIMPQMNIFVVSFPMKIGVGAFVVMASAPLMVYLFKKLLAGFEENVLELVKAM